MRWGRGWSPDGKGYDNLLDLLVAWSPAIALAIFLSLLGLVLRWLVGW